MASKILCATAACGKPATHQAIRRGQIVGFVCGECRIGANGGAMSAGGGAAMLAKRQDQERRASDIELMATSLGKLAHLRSYMYQLTPLELSTTTLAIGRNFGESGDDAANFVDQTISDVIDLIQRIHSGAPYTMDLVRKRMAKLREDLAADASLDAFDAAVGPDASRLMSEDSRRLAAYRANPVQIIAELNDVSGTANINELVQTNSRLRATNDVIGIFPYFAIDFYGLTENINRVRISDDPDKLADSAFDGTWYLSGASSLYHNYDRTVIYAKPDTLVQPAIARGNYLCSFYTLGDIVKCRVFRADKASKTFVELSDVTIYDRVPAEFPIFDQSRFLVPLPFARPAKKLSAHVARVAIDADANIWHVDKPAQYDTGDAVIVRNSNGTRIASIKMPGCFAICAAADGVWVASASGGVMKFTNMRLVPSEVYNRGM